MIEIQIKSNEFAYDLKALSLTFFPEEECQVIGNDTMATREDYPIRCLFDGEVFFEESISFPYDKNKVKQVVYKHYSEKTGKKLPWGILTGIRPTKIPLRKLQGGLEPGEIRKELTDTYLCNEEKVNLAMEIATKEFQLTSMMKHGDYYSLYIGIPFCPTRCHYCSFAAYPMKQYKNRVDEYLDALEKEMKYVSQAYRYRQLSCIYVGGGTPTSLDENQLRRLLMAIHHYFKPQKGLEFTVEAGRPDSITREKLLVMKEMEVTRISINPQTMKQATLDKMGRLHSVESIISVFHLARELKFDNINMDLIAGLPGETALDFKETLNQLHQLNPDSITIHTLVIKRASLLREEIDEQDGLIPYDEEVEKMQRIGYEYCKENGYQPYYMYHQKNKANTSANVSGENVAYAKPGKECLYNIFIMEELETILALGAGGSSKYVFDGQEKMERVGNVKSIEEYISRIDEMIERKEEFRRTTKWR